MFSITLKRSAATLGVVLAGLLAAAGPASARLSPTASGVKSPAPCADVPAQLSIGGAEAAGFVNGCAPGFAPVRQVGSEALALDDDGPRVRTLDVASVNDTVAARGTQVGSEGVKARANAGHQMEDEAVVVLIGANDYGWTEGNDNPCCRHD